MPNFSTAAPLLSTPSGDDPAKYGDAAPVRNVGERSGSEAVGLGSGQTEKGCRATCGATGILITACSIEIADPFRVGRKAALSQGRRPHFGVVAGVKQRRLVTALWGLGWGINPECAGLSAVIARHVAKKQTTKASLNLRKVFVPGGLIRECEASLLHQRSDPCSRGCGEDSSHSPNPTH